MRRIIADEKADIFEVEYLHGSDGRICGRHKREGVCALPGEIWLSAIRLPMLKDSGMGNQKSAEVIVDSSIRIEGPNVL